MRLKQEGVSLIEVLITIVVMSFGLLALASFQVKSLSYLSLSNQYYQVTAVAESISENIRANGISNFSITCELQICNIDSDNYLKEQLESIATPEIKATASSDASGVVKINIEWVEKRLSILDRNNDERSNYELQVLL